MGETSCPNQMTKAWPIHCARGESSRIQLENRSVFRAFCFISSSSHMIGQLACLVASDRPREAFALMNFDLELRLGPSTSCCCCCCCCVLLERRLDRSTASFYHQKAIQQRDWIQIEWPSFHHLQARVVVRLLLLVLLLQRSRWWWRLVGCLNEVRCFLSFSISHSCCCHESLLAFYGLYLIWLWL